MQRSLRAFAPALVWAAAIWVLGGLPLTPTVGPGLGLDKVVHFVMYGGLGLLLARAWRGQRWRGATLLPFLFTVLLGAADEMRQLSVEGRAAEVADWIADALGAAAGIVIGHRLAQGHTTLTGNDDE